MATLSRSGTISQRTRKLAMNPVLPFQTHNNIFLFTDANTGISDQDSSKGTHEVLIQNHPPYGPLIPPASTNAAHEPANDSSSGKHPYQIEVAAMQTDNNRRGRPAPVDKPHSNLSALLAQTESRSHEPLSAILASSTGAQREHAHDDAGHVSPSESKLPRTSSSPPSLIPSFIPPRENVAETGKGNIDPKKAFVKISTRRCFSSRDLRRVVPSSGSPYARMLYQKEAIESQMTERLNQTRQITFQGSSRNPSTLTMPDDMSSSSSRGVGGTMMMTNEARNKRRAEHNRAVRNDLCEIVTDLFIAESKLLNPSKYGVETVRREKVFQSVDRFIAALPPRYALSAETPSEVLLHMRLMQGVRVNASRPTVHIAKVESDRHWGSSNTNTSGSSSQMLVTVACADAVGLLEYISRLLASGGSRVLDADVMLSSDNIVLDRFVVEMNGRLRLDKLATYIEKFLEKSRKKTADVDNAAPGERSCSMGSGGSDSFSNSKAEFSGSLYYQPTESEANEKKVVEDEIKSALPLSALIAGQGGNDPMNNNMLGALTSKFQPLTRNLSLPPNFRSREQAPLSDFKEKRDSVAVVDHPGDYAEGSGDAVAVSTKPTTGDGDNSGTESIRKRRPLVNRQGNSDLDNIGDDQDEEDHPGGVSIEYVTLDGTGSQLESRHVPLIPFDELMLIETLGMGRVSTIYRAAWTSSTLGAGIGPPQTAMLALKVAMVNPKTMDTSHVDELRREADIAARLGHPNVCSLAGVAADSECFCLAYEFCEGGSLLSLLSDSSRFYEYLPIALDVASGMAYLHSRNVIHRDLKPSNILLTRDNRAKIADFGMSVTHTGQELTAETGTYRYMAPEVIRHESYSSNADVYSFGICLWQLISREVPFATMTPIQAAYAVAEGRRPPIPESTPRRLREIITSCWDQDSRKRPSFTYIAMALADYAKMAFSPANIGMQTLNIANEMLANVEGNSTVNVDFSAPVLMGTYLMSPDPDVSNVGLEI